MKNHKSTLFLPLFSAYVTVTLISSILAEKTYTNRFAIKVTPNANPDEIARSLGFTNQGKIGSLDDHYLFVGHHISKRSTEPHDTGTCVKHQDILWSEQQHAKRRFKRDGLLDLPSASPKNLTRSKSAILPSPYHHGEKDRSFSFKDPLFDKQWYYNAGGRGRYDMNVIPVWKMGYTGKGVVLTILDDGVQPDHPDLSKNYDKKASYDINGGDDNPTPQNNGENKHGTRCAGEIAAEAGNEYCGIGIAYNASIGGVRMLDGTVTDDVEAQALGLNPNHIDVYSASWGPDDNGKTVDGPGHLTAQAFINGVTKGRNGLGSIYVWASGNGGKKQDNCNCDGYTNSIYTLSISSATQRGLKPWYLEECSSTLATTYSSGTPIEDANIVTSDQSNEMQDALKEGRKPNPAKFCTQVHTGTSASAPIAAGIIALALEANPKLTWRDMQHIVVQTSRHEPLKGESGWVENAVKRHVSHKFGYGLMDADAMVKRALRWQTVPQQMICPTTEEDKELLIQDDLNVSLTTDACAGTANAINYLEHVQARISLKFQPRGNLRISLISPSGTPTHLLMPRPRDNEEDTFDNWPFMTVHFWGENPRGTWKLIVRNENRRRGPEVLSGVLYSWSLVFYGTATLPQLNSVQPLTPNSSTPPKPTFERLVIGDEHSENIEDRQKWRSAWAVPIFVVMSIFVITILVFVTVVSLLRMGSKLAKNVGIRFSRPTNNSRTPNHTAIYSELDTEASMEC